MKINQAFKGYLNVPSYTNKSDVIARNTINTDNICESDILRSIKETVITAGDRKFHIPFDIASTKEIIKAYNKAKMNNTYEVIQHSDYPIW